MSDHSILIADIGGTNARFAFSTPSTPFFTKAQTLACADYPTIEDAIDTFLSSNRIQKIDVICLAVAGPITNESVDFTNNNWSIRCADLRSRYKIKQAHLLNDFEAIAHSLTILDKSDLIDIGGQWAKASNKDFTLAVIGPGSGLGIAGLCQRNKSIFTIVSEGGHAGFAPENSLQIEVINYLHKKYARRVSRERVLSGPGLVNIHEALCNIAGQQKPTLTAAEIAESAIERSNESCVQSLELFFEILGQVAGDTALSIGASDGVFIGGGIAQRYPEELSNSRFRLGFENKGRYKEQLKKIPTWLIAHKNPGLLGASIYAQRFI